MQRIKSQIKSKYVVLKERKRKGIELLGGGIANIESKTRIMDSCLNAGV